MTLQPSSPLLSICIPTLNRADLLKVSLENVLSEAEAFPGEVEVVVSDNASTDGTAQILAAYAGRVRSQRLDSTVGYASSVLSAVCDLAQGHFVWVLGDDDMIIRGSLKRVLDSLREHPEIAYHYLNFGWIDVKARTDVVLTMDSVPPIGPSTVWQCDTFETLDLNRIEDLTFLPGNNPSALFSGIFCFVAKRDIYISQRYSLNPSNSLDGSSVLLDDCFPHAMITLPKMAGHAVRYLGQPCLLQGVGGWEWKGYAYKNMLFGTHQLFSWLEDTSFSRDGLNNLWSSYYNMAGRLFLRMLYFRDEHLGADLVMQRSIPSASSHHEFWEAFLNEFKLVHECELEARFLADKVTNLLKEFPSARVGLWGMLGRGLRFIKFSGITKDNLVWVSDRDPVLQGKSMETFDVCVQSPDSLGQAGIDILVLGTRGAFVNEISSRASREMKPGSLIVSVAGVVSV